MGYETRLDATTVESSDTEGVLTVGSAVPAGDTVLGAVVWSQDAPSIPTVSSIVDSRGNTYVVDVGAGTGNSTASCVIFRGTIETALQIGDTITVTIAQARVRWALAADRVSGLADDPLDKTAATDVGSSSSLSTGTTAATAQDDEFLYAAFAFGRGSDQDISAVGSGWTATAQVNTTSGTVKRGLLVAHRTVSATGAQEGTATATGTTVYSACIATYKIEGAHSGSAAITASLTMAAAGTPDVDGTAEITGALGMTATGSPDVTGGAGLITGQLAMSARGRADTSIGLPPRPRTRWQLVLGPASGGHELALTEAHGRRYTARLNENSDLSFSIDGRHPQADAIGELVTDVHLLFSDSTGTQILDRCRVGPTRDEVSEDEHRVEVTALDYREVLARRILYSDDTLTYTGVDQAEIAWALVDATQQRPAGHLGIDKGWTGTSPTGIDRDRTYEAGDSIGQRIQELSEVIDGFDWDISPVSASGLQLDVWHPMRGSDRGVVLIYGGLVAHVQREVNPSDYANALRYTGAEGDEEDPGPDPVEIEAPLLGQDGDWPQGRWDAAFGDDGLITQATLNERAAWQLAESQVIRPVYTVRLKRGGWGGPDHIWLGDTVRLIVASGRLRVDAPLRVHEIQLDIDEDGGETATLTLGGPRPDFRRWPSRVDRRLRDLERR